MKIAVTGKGGSGKTTIAAHLSVAFADKGYRVIAVDADPSLNMSAIFGYEDIKSIGEIKEIVEEKTKKADGIYILNPDVKDLIDRYSVKVKKNLNLIASSTIKRADSGCLCPENALIKALMRELILDRDEVVIMDMEAGLEIMSRGTVKNINKILVITETNRGSILVTEKILRFSRELGIRDSYVIGNKIRNNDIKLLEERFDVFYYIPYLNEVQESSTYYSLLGKNTIFYKRIEELLERLIYG